MRELDDIKALLAGSTPIILIRTHEETRALDLLRAANRQTGKALIQWSVTSVLRNVDAPVDRQPLALVAASPDDRSTATESSADPQAALRKIQQDRSPGIFVLLDFHHYLADPINARLLKEIALDYAITGHQIVLISHALSLPGELERLTVSFSLSLPDQGALRAMVDEECAVYALKNVGSKVLVDEQAVLLLIRNLLGLSISDARRLIRSAIHRDGALTHNDLPEVQRAKYQLISQDGLLSFEYDTTQFNEVGGLYRMKRWLDQRRKHFIDGTDSSADRPKGVLLVGVQGSGKSLAAKAIAGVWQVPLLRLDFGALYNKFFGETERNLREALELAELMAPCVVWIDEIEKGLSTGDNDNGTSRRILGALLTWMSEHKSRVFLVATANDIEALPPELIRKGRFDEIFFVDLPDTETRAIIFTIHLRKRGADPAEYDTAQLAAQSSGFSGAEIEQAIVAARYSAQARSGTLDTAGILAELGQTKPLSLIMAEKIDALRAWAQERTVPAT